MPGSNSPICNSFGAFLDAAPKVEGGERRIDVVEFVEMANALGVVPSSLLKKLEAALSAKD